MQDLVERVEEALEFARRAGAEAAEAYVIDAPEDTVSFEPAGAGGEPELRTALTVPRRGLGLAARWGRRVGFASTTDLGREALAGAVEAARRAAVPEDPPLPLTPPASPAAEDADAKAGAGAGPPGGPGVPGLADPRLIEMNLPDLVEVIREMAAQARADGATVLEAVGMACCRRVAVGNTLGLVRSSVDTRLSGAVYAATGAGGFGARSRTSRSLDGFRSLAVGRRAAAFAKAAEGARDVVPGPQTVVLRPDAVLSLLANSLGPALGADRVLEGGSPFAAPRPGPGDLVAAGILNLTDDATRPGGTGSYLFDAEGTTGRVTPLVTRGRLVSFLHNNRTAGMWPRPPGSPGAPAGPGSTGNASRDRSDRMSTFVEPSGLFGYRPGVAPSNLVVTAPGATYPTLEAAGVGGGLLVNDVMGAFVIDPAVGDFSVTTTNAWALERGRLAYPVKRAMLTGNVYSLLKQVVALLEEPEDVAGSFSLYSPSWVVAGLTVV